MHLFFIPSMRGFFLTFDSFQDQPLMLACYLKESIGQVLGKSEVILQALFFSNSFVKTSLIVVIIKR